MSGKLYKLTFTLALATAGACANETTELVVSTPDRASFEQTVYPVLMRDCAFSACHGSAERFLQVFGPGRGRISLDIKPLDPISPIEVEHAYNRARSMVDAIHPDQSLLLRKPLATKAGGSGHEGTDELGRNVYQSKLDPAYAAISAWVLGTSATVPAGAVPSGSSGLPSGTPPGSGVQR
ncbi:MAG TPA: hypothetical protein VFG30_41415 [Polyangiales bacterium]|jgi:hypothetical protein|nr:hypothetical protein [Polyangiales bacterium]